MEQYIDTIIQIILLIIGGILIPFIKKLVTTYVSNSAWDKVQNYITKAVKCANQIYTKEEWEQKKNFVTESVEEFMKSNAHINITDKQLNTLIEGIVNEVKEIPNKETEQENK